MSNISRSDKFLERVKDVVSPEVYAQISARMADAVEDNQNQNQNGSLTEELAQLKPAVLRELVIGSNLGDEQMDNQNQNQGKLADLMKLKPEVLRQLRITLRGEEVMDNQNQNQGSVRETDLTEKPRP